MNRTIQSDKAPAVAEEFQTFEYPSAPANCVYDWSGISSLSTREYDAPSAFRNDQNSNDTGTSPDAIQFSPEERIRILEAGRLQGFEEGRVAGKREAEAAVQLERTRHMQQIASSIQAIVEEKNHLFQKVEREVVDLALGIASHILRREAQSDPLFLTNSVRTALGQLSGSMKATLLVPASELKMWEMTFANLPNLPVRPEILADQGMETGDCSLRTEIGTVDLGFRAQLKEVTKGFVDKCAVHSLPPNLTHLPESLES